MKIIIDIPDVIHKELIKIAEDDGRKTKPYVERMVKHHVEKYLNKRFTRSQLQSQS
jgi:hypothetical protein